MLRERQPAWATRFCQELEACGPAGAESLREAAGAGRLLEEAGWQQRPSRPALLQGARPEVVTRQQNERAEDGAESQAEAGATELGEW